MRSPGRNAAPYHSSVNALHLHGSHGIEDGDNRHTHIGKNRQPHVGNSESRQNENKDFTPRAKTIFCFTMPSVLREILMAAAILDGSSVMITTSAASMAASLPRPPMAIPISALARTGSVVNAISHKYQPAL